MMAWGLQMLIGLPIGFVADFIGEREVMAVLGVLGLVLALVGTMGWLAIIKRAPAPAIEFAETPDLRGAALPQPVPPPLSVESLRSVALMSGQKPTD